MSDIPLKYQALMVGGDTHPAIVPLHQMMNGVDEIARLAGDDTQTARVVDQVRTNLDHFFNLLTAELEASTADHQRTTEALGRALDTIKLLEQQLPQGAGQ